MKNGKMKPHFYVILIILLMFKMIASAQEDYAIERANGMTNYIAEKMSLNKDQSMHLNLALVSKIRTQKIKIQEKDLTEAETKEVYINAGRAFYAILNRRFSKADMATIKQHMTEFNEKFNKKPQS